MAATVNLPDIIDALEMQSDERRAYLNVTTGEVVTMTDEELGLDDELSDALDESTDDDESEMNELAESENYLQLPDQFEIDEYGMMESFCLSLTDEHLRNTLYNAIKGSGAFRRFKDNIGRLGIEEDWYKYREQRFKDIAIDWCKEHEIPYVE